MLKIKDILFMILGITLTIFMAIVCLPILLILSIINIYSIISKRIAK